MFFRTPVHAYKKFQWLHIYTPTNSVFQTDRRDAGLLLHRCSKAQTSHWVSIAANDRGTDPPSVLQARETISNPDRASNPVQIGPDVRNILRGPIVEFPTQYSALRYASDGMLDHQCEDLRIYSYEWYRSPFHQSEHLFAHRLIFFYLHFSTPITNRRRRVMYSGPVTGADATAVLIEIPVQHVMHRLDAPVPVVVFEKLLDICLYGTQARDSVRIFPPAFTALVFVFDNPFHHERLPDMWKFKILAKLRFHPDPAALDAPVLKVGCS